MIELGVHPDGCVSCLPARHRKCCARWGGGGAGQAGCGLPGVGTPWVGRQWGAEAAGGGQICRHMLPSEAP